MTAKKRPVKQNLLLTAVARKLGHAAGKLTKATHELTENISALPGAVTEKLRGTANAGTAKKKARTSGSHPKKKAGSASQLRTPTPVPDNRTSRKNNSPRGKKKSRTRAGK
jgi:hypothetical protein